jgi:hypothetical protein
LVAEDSLSWRLEDTSLPSNYVLDAVAAIKIPRRIVLLDACRERVEASRGLAADPRSAISKELNDALGRAHGQVVLSAARLGGYAFDDVDRQNGVFTGAVLDGLRCGATGDPQGFVTIQSLKDYIEGTVIDWIRMKKRGELDWEPGIQSVLDGPVLQLPLAACASAQVSPPAGGLTLCLGKGASMTSCEGVTFTIKVNDFWEHGTAVSLAIESNRIGPVDTGALTEGATRDFALGDTSCTMMVLQIAEPCVTITLLNIKKGVES